MDKLVCFTIEVFHHAVHASAGRLGQRTIVPPVSATADRGTPPVTADHRERPGPPTPDAERTIIGARYALDLATPIGGGGLCLVYGGLDLRTRRPVAVKSLRTEHDDDPETRARFRREARLLAFLSHPNVVRVYDFVEDQEATWVVMERVTGSSLRDLIDERGTLSPAEIGPLLTQVAAGLTHLHERGLVHLDVTPRNLLLTGDERTLKLIDFGLSQAAGTAQETIGGQTFGTAAYLAPEQVRGEPVDPATDIYALGCVVYELLTGAPPFAPGPSERKEATIRARLERDPTAPTVARPDLALPPWVDAILGRALATDPDVRYAQADSFARAFQAAIDADEPGEGAIIVGPSPPPLEQPRAPIPLAIGRNPYARPPDWPAADPFAADGRRSRNLPRGIERLLWLGVFALVAANLILGTAFLVVRGELPGLYRPSLTMTPGARARAITDDLLVRASPSLAGNAVGLLAADDRVLLSGAPIIADGEIWWPIITGDDSDLIGYAAGGWLEPVGPPTPLERARRMLGLS